MDATQPTPPAYIMSMYKGFAPERRHIGDHSYFSFDGEISADVYSGRNPQTRMQERALDIAPGALQFSRELKTNTGSTRSYHATGVTRFVDELVKTTLKAIVTGRGFSSVYEISDSLPPSARDSSNEGNMGGSVTVPCMDLDGHAFPNQGMLMKLEQSGLVPKTPILDKCSSEMHDPETLRGLTHDSGVPFPKAYQAICLTAAEAFATALTLELSTCPEVESIMFEPQFFSSCQGQKISYHVILRTFVSDAGGVWYEIVFDSIKEMKALYEKCTKDYFGDRPQPNQEHPFLAEPDDTWTPHQIQMWERSICWLVKCMKKKTIWEIAIDPAILSLNRVFRAPYGDKVSRSEPRPKLPALRGTDGNLYTVHLAEQLPDEYDPDVPLGEEIFDEEGPYWPPLGMIRHILRGMITFVPPGKPFIRLKTRSSAINVKKRARRAAARTAVASGEYEISVPKDALLFDQTFDYEGLCADIAGIILPAKASSFHVEGDGSLVKVYCATAGVAPCRHKKETHDSNNFWFHVKLEYGRWRVYQFCHNAVCGAKGAFYCAEESDQLQYDDYVDTSDSTSRFADILGVISDDEDGGIESMIEDIRTTRAGHEARLRARAAEAKEVLMIDKPESKRSICAQYGGVAAAVDNMLDFFGVATE
jgi:hypothetical protein